MYILSFFLWIKDQYNFSFLGSLSNGEDGEETRECCWILSAIFAQSQLKPENVIQVHKQLADICN